jgi:hypothetical protein
MAPGTIVPDPLDEWERPSHDVLCMVGDDMVLRTVDGNAIVLSTEEADRFRALHREFRTRHGEFMVL